MPNSFTDEGNYFFKDATLIFFITLCKTKLIDITACEEKLFYENYKEKKIKTIAAIKIAAIKTNILHLL